MAIPAAAIVGITALSAVLGTVGTVVTAVQQSNTAKANQQMANQQAQAAQEQSRVQQEQIKRRGLLALGQQKAAAAASGVDPGDGSVLDVEDDTTRQIQYDVLKTKYNGDMNAWAYRAQAGQFGAQASNAMISGGINTTSSLLNGATSTYKTGVNTGLWDGPTF